MDSRTSLSVLVAVFALALGAVYLHRRTPALSQAPAAESSQVVTLTLARPPSPSASRSEASSAASTAPSVGLPRASSDAEPTLQALHDLLAAAPERALERARAELHAEPNGPTAAERAWIVVRALDQLGRHHQAQAETRAMLARYPNSRWTEDAERHTLVYPLDQPSREAQQQLLPAEHAQGHDEADQGPH